MFKSGQNHKYAINTKNIQRSKIQLYNSSVAHHPSHVNPENRPWTHTGGAASNEAATAAHGDQLDPKSLVPECPSSTNVHCFENCLTHMRHVTQICYASKSCSNWQQWHHDLQIPNVSTIPWQLVLLGMMIPLLAATHCPAWSSSLWKKKGTCIFINHGL